MSLSVIAILVLFAFGASFTQRVTGFGFGIFIMTILPHIMPSYAEATALSGLLALTNVIATSIKLRSAIQWRKLAIIVPVFLLTSFFCVKAVSMIDNHTLKRVLGGVLVLISIYFFRFSDKIHLKPSIPVQSGMGFLSGIMGGFFAMQGPPAVIYFLSCTETKEQYMALISIYFIISNSFMTAFRAVNGFITPTVLKCFLIALPAIFIGYLIGTRVSIGMPIKTLRKTVYAFMAVSGVIAIIL